LEAQLDISSTRIAELVSELRQACAASVVDHERCLAAEDRASNELEQVHVIATTELEAEQPKELTAVATVALGNTTTEQVEESEGAREGSTEAVLLPVTIGNKAGDVLHPMQTREALELDGSVENLHVLLKELQKSNVELQRQMNSRPIVYQFGDVPDCFLDDDCDDEGELPFPMTHCQSEYLMGRKFDFHTLCCVLYGGCVALRRRCAKFFLKCRKLKCTKCTELRLRSFTRSLLYRPSLLWLFYMQLFAIWIVEIWRQAVSSMGDTPHKELEQPVFAFMSN